MARFDTYVDIAQYIKDTWSRTQVFMKNEDCSGDEFIVIDTYGLGAEQYFREINDIRGWRIIFYAKHYGTIEKLISEFIQQYRFDNNKPTAFEDMRVDGATVQLENSLYEGVIKFTTKNMIRS